MLSPKMLAVVAASLLCGIATGWIFSQPPSPAPFKNGSAAESSAKSAANPKTPLPRAVADVTPGRENAKPLPTLSELLHPKNQMHFYRDAQRFADSLDVAGIQKVLAQLATEPDGMYKQKLLSNLVSRLGRLDPQMGMQTIANVKDRTQRDSLYGALAYGWSQKDLKGAKAWAASLPNGRLQQLAMEAVISALGETDPNKALQLVLSQPQRIRNSDSYAYTIFQTLASRNPQDAAEKAVALPPGRLRDQALGVVASQWANTDPEAAAHWAESFPFNNSGQSAISMALSQWVRRDPSKASAYAETLPPGPTRDQAMKSLANNWAQQDGPAALAWVDKLPAGDSRTKAMRASLSQWAESDPKAAGDYILKHSAGDSAQNLSTISYPWGRQDPQGALKWAQGLNDPAVEEKFLVNVLGQWATNVPEKAVASLASLKSPLAKKNAIAQIANVWSQTDPTKALGWLVRLPSDSTRDDAMSAAVGNWTHNSAPEVTQWLTQLPAGCTRDQMVATFSNSVANDEPENAAAWASSIADPKIRRDALSNTIDTWGRADRAKATNWVNQQNFTPEERQAFLARISPE